MYTHAIILIQLFASALRAKRNLPMPEAKGRGEQGKNTATAFGLFFDEIQSSCLPLPLLLPPWRQPKQHTIKTS